MKKSLLTLVFAAACYCASAQTTPVSAGAKTAAATPTSYADMLGTTIAAVMNTGDAAQLKSLASKLERAAAVAPADWLPRYYQAYALLINVFQSKEDGDVKDATLDQAETALAKARQLKGDESELLTLQAYIYQARLGISPMLRSAKYSRLVNETVAQAKKLNPANPRPYLVGANNVYYTPSIFGGGAEAAKPLYEEAKAKYATFQPASPLAPNWGQDQLLGRLKKYEVATVQVIK
jgi:ABC-type oligopeptide transport system substrate-binding subunit